MKKLFPLFILFILVGAGCKGDIQPTDPETSTPPSDIEITEISAEEVNEIEGEDIQDSWRRITAAVEAEDCEAFQERFVHTVTLTEQDCADYFAFYNFLPPLINWWETKYQNYALPNTTITEAEVYLANGQLMASFYLDSDNTWRAARVFWSVNHAE